jgi:hypothetical protein
MRRSMARDSLRRNAVICSLPTRSATPASLERKDSWLAFAKAPDELSKADAARYYASQESGIAPDVGPKKAASDVVLPRAGENWIAESLGTRPWAMFPFAGGLNPQRQRHSRFGRRANHVLRQLAGAQANKLEDRRLVKCASQLKFGMVSVGSFESDYLRLI